MRIFKPFNRLMVIMFLLLAGLTVAQTTFVCRPGTLDPRCPPDCHANPADPRCKKCRNDPYYACPIETIAVQTPVWGKDDNGNSIIVSYTTAYITQPVCRWIPRWRCD